MQRPHGRVMVGGTSSVAEGAARAGRGRTRDAAPFSVTRVTSSDIEEQAASLRAVGPGLRADDAGPLRRRPARDALRAAFSCSARSTNQAVHEAGAPWTGLARDRRARPPGRRGAVPRRARRHRRRSSRWARDDELDFYTPRGFEIFGLVVDECALEAHARQVEHRDLAVAFAGKVVFKPAPERLSEFRRLLTSVLQSLDVNPTALQYRQTQRVLEQSIFGAVVAVVADDGCAPKAAPVCPGRRHVVDAAKAFMDSRIAEPITVADLCRELGVSRRTLQYSFQEVLGINPVAFLRAMRLNGVRRDLRAASRPGDAVQDISARWGFWHLGHFVTDYKRMFGELPSATLRTRRRAGAGLRR